MNPWRNGRPPIGPISPAQDIPASSAGADAGDGRSVVVGFAEQGAAAAVAGEQEGAGRLCAGEQVAQLRIGGGGVAHLELHDRSHLDLGADRDRLALAHRSEHVAHQEVARPEGLLALVDDHAEVEALGGEATVLGRQALDRAQESGEGRLAGELLDQVARRTRHHHRVADRPAALGDDGAGRDLRWQQDTDGAVVVQPPVEHEPVAPGSPGRRRQPADDGQLRCAGRQRVEHEVDGEAERDRRGARGSEARPRRRGGRGRRRPRSSATASSRTGDRRSGALGEPGGQQGEGRTLLDLVAGPGDHRRGRAEQHARLDEGLHGADDVVEGAGAGRRRRTARPGRVRSPSCSSTAPTTSPVAWATTGCCDSAAAQRVIDGPLSSTGEDRERHDDGLAACRCGSGPRRCPASSKVSSARTSR